MKQVERTPWLAIVILAIAMAAIVGAQQTKSLPPPFATPSANNRPRVIPQPADRKLQVPQGFSVAVWADGFERPRFMLQGSRGEILIADSGAPPQPGGQAARSGVVYAIAPGADPTSRKKMIENLDRPFGLALWKNYLYVGETTSIKRFDYEATTLTAGTAEEIVSLVGFSGGHWTRALLFDRAGQKLYVGVGSGSNVDAGEDPRRAAINRYNPDGSGHEIFASGTRNPTSLHWYPNTDTLWASVQERDGLGDDLPPDYFTHIQPHGFYGWPFAYFGPNEEPRHKGENLELVKKTIVPDVSLGAHVAVLDFAFYTGTRFPAEYRGGAFLALHGSWNRSKRTGYSVAFVPFRNARPSGEPREFLAGWMIAPESTDVWGRPVGVLQLQDGSLLVSDDGGKRIWRVNYDGTGAMIGVLKGAEGC